MSCFFTCMRCFVSSHCKLVCCYYHGMVCISQLLKRIMNYLFTSFFLPLPSFCVSILLCFKLALSFNRQLLCLPFWFVIPCFSQLHSASLSLSHFTSFHWTISVTLILVCVVLSISLWERLCCGRNVRLLQIFFTPNYSCYYMSFPVLAIGLTNNSFFLQLVCYDNQTIKALLRQ